MLRFRPIAPKPADGKPFSSAFPAEAPGGAASRRRVKRRYRVRVRKKSVPDGKISRSDAVGGGGGTGSDAADNAATLQLLPGREEDRESAGAGCTDGRRPDSRAGFEEGGALTIGGGEIGASDRAVVESRVTVESVGGACMGSGGSLGSTDVERLRSLEVDTCPAFVTDSLNRVRWLNAAYAELVTGGGEGGEEVEVRVGVAASKELPWRSSAFACQVRVEHTWRNGRYSKLVPCDVWRLDWGGFAWRLDVKAALSLGF